MKKQHDNIHKWKNTSVATEPTDYWRSLNVKSGRINKTAATNIIRRWKIFFGKLVCEPGGDAFINPLRSLMIGQCLYIKWRNQQIMTIFLTALAIAAVLLARGTDDASHKFIDLLAIFELFVFANYIVSPSATSLAERSEFFSAVAANARNCLWFVLLMGVLSLVFSRLLFGTFEESAQANGAVISKVMSGQVWRIFTGSLVHYDFKHLIGNFILLAIVFPVASYYSVRVALIGFVAGVLFGQVCFILLGVTGWHHYDVLVGYSGGMYSLLGYLAIDSFVIKRKYPGRFTILIVAFIFVCLVGAKIMNPLVSMIAHASGLVFGVGMSISEISFRKFRSKTMGD